MEKKTDMGVEDVVKKKIKWFSEEGSQRLIFIVLLVSLLLGIGISYCFANILSKGMNVPGLFFSVVFVVSVVIIVMESINKRVQWKNYRWPYACLIIMFAFSLIMSLDAAIPRIAFLGNFYRGEGLLAIGGYYGIFFLATMLVNKRYRSYLIYIILGIGIICMGCGILQYFNVCVLWGGWPRMASFGFINPNFYASFAILFSGIAMGGFWLYREDSIFLHPVYWWKQGMWLALVICSYIMCLISGSSVVYVGLIMMFLLMFFLEFVTKRKSLSKIFIMLLSLIIVMIMLNIFSEGGIMGEFTKTYREIKQEGSVFGDSVGTNRMKIWKNVVALLPMYWLYGCGIEHLGYVYYFVYGFEGQLAVKDRAHNEYLDLWVSRGIIPLVAYLVFLFLLFIPGIIQYIKKNRYNSDDHRLLLIFPFFGYIAQAFFNISMLPVASFFWLICGMLLMTEDNVVEREKVPETQEGVQLRNDPEKIQTQAFNEIPEKNIEKI